jgi:hypothetical protein
MASLQALVPGLVTVLLAVGTMLPQDSIAVPLDINVLDSTYTTVVQTTLSDPPMFTTRTKVSSDPIADFIRSEVTLVPLTHVGEASASANTFDVTAAATTFSLDSNANKGRSMAWATLASARTDLVFSPLHEGIASLTLVYNSSLDSFTSGFVVLSDLTSHTELVSYSKSGHGFEELTFDRFFDDDHSYSLSLFATSNANGDSEDLNISLSGFQVPPAPEPETYALMLAGLAAVGFAARRRKLSRGLAITS